MAGSSPARPRSLADPHAVVERRRMLHLPHMVPLARYAAALRSQNRGSVPEFDPLDGGTGAKVLFLLEKPGPMTDEGREGARAGSGFVSRDNDDPTAEAIFRFMDVVGIPREETLIWNLIPWWNGTRKVTGPEVREGATAVARLVDLLPALRAVMLVGRRAARAAPLLDRFALPILVSPHPSPVVRASRPALWSSIPERWALLLPHLRR